MSRLCPQCGAPVADNVTKCEYCGASVPAPAQPQAQAQTAAQPQPQPQIVYVQQPATNPERANWPIKNKIVAAILAILLGSLGVHKFYLGQTFKGILFLIFCWTYIPSVL